MTSPQPSARSGFFSQLLIVLIYLGVLALDIWIFLVIVRGTWDEKVALLLQVLALYTFTFGFLMQTEVLKRFGGITEGMTSPNLFRFVRGNFHFLAILFLIISVALEPRKTRFSQIYLYPLDVAILLIVTLAILVHTVFHLTVIMPIAYVAYATVSIPIRNIQTSARDFSISVGKETVRIQDIFSANLVSVRNFLIAVPAIVFSTLLKLVSIFR